MTDTMPGRRAAPIVAVALVAVASALASWAAFAPGDTAAAPVAVATTAGEPTAVATTTAPIAPTATQAPATTVTTVTTPGPVDTTTTTTTPAVVTSAAGAAAPLVPAVDEVVLATLGPDAVEAWTPDGRIGTAHPCGGEPTCLVMTSAWAGDAVVSAVLGRDAAPASMSLVRAPIDGRPPTVLVTLESGAWASHVSVAGGAVWWLEQAAPMPTGRVRHRPLDGSAPVSDLVAGVVAAAPSPDGRRLAVHRPSATGQATSSLAVVEVDTRRERSLSLGADVSWLTGLTWIDADRLVLQTLDASTVVDASPGRDPRIEWTISFVASCVDNGSRIVGVQRTTAADGSMRHRLAEADPSTGTVTPWAGADLGDGTIACRGDGAVVAVAFTPGSADTELVVARASGRRTVLGRGYTMLAARRGTGSFSPMNCGPAGAGENGPI